VVVGAPEGTVEAAAAPAAPVAVPPGVAGGAVEARVAGGAVEPGVVGPALAAGGEAVVGTAAGAPVGLASERTLDGARLEPESPASFTSAAASTASASSATAASSTTSTFQRGDAASRVRAAAPQCRHQSWAGSSGLLQSGHKAPISSASSPCGPA
jgi:hypothetical protein